MPTIAERARSAGGHYELIDLLPTQIANARRKVGDNSAAHIQQMNAVALDFPDHSFDNVLLFFLLHELPQDWRERVMAEALRVLAPGGKMVITDFGKPAGWNIFFRFFWLPMLGILEPFAIPLWRHELADILPAQMGQRTWHQQKYFGGLFQKLVGTK